MAIKSVKALTAKLLAEKVLKVIREADMPVAEDNLPKFVKLELGALAPLASDEAIIGAATALRSENKLMTYGRFRGRQMVGLAW